MNVGRLHRVLRLVTILQSGAGRSANELARELGVSRRTLFRDLKMLETAGVPYYFEPGRGYRIASDFFLPPVNLKVGEAMGLMTLARIASAQGDQPLLQPAAEAVRKLIAMMPAPIRDVCQEMMTRVSVSPPATSQPEPIAEHHAALQQAIDQQRVVRMHYHPLSDDGETRVTLHPYHLHFEMRSWYVIGYGEQARQIRTYKLMRIGLLELLDRTFRLTQPFDIDQHLGKAWRLIPEGRVYDIELEFTPKVARNVAEVRWHRTQQHQILDDGRCIMHFQVDGLGEISWWLLGYGDQVYVRKPKALRDRVARYYRSALDKIAQREAASEHDGEPAPEVVVNHQQALRRR